MKDLVERLRESSRQNYIGGCHGCDDTERGEAADMIEQLERSLTDTRKLEYAQQIELRVVKAQNERLRAALTYIRDRINDMPRSPRNDYADGEKAGIQWASDNAADALAVIEIGLWFSARWDR